jgi:hypothetical protein
MNYYWEGLATNSCCGPSVTTAGAGPAASTNLGAASLGSAYYAALAYGAWCRSTKYGKK